jgi:hypothetical protein
MKPELKRYYLMQMAYWVQQLLVLVLGLEKPRKDYHELVAHHIVTIWLVGWSYLVNLTLIGNAVYMSMDIPDAALAVCSVRVLLDGKAEKVGFLVFQTPQLHANGACKSCFLCHFSLYLDVSYCVFLVSLRSPCTTSYFRHILNFYILWSVWSEYDLVPYVNILPPFPTLTNLSLLQAILASLELGKWNLLELVDEVSNLRSSFPVTAAQSVLVLPHCPYSGSCCPLLDGGRRSFRRRR